MSDIKTAVSKFVNRRRLTGGEFSYVFKPTDECVAGKKAVWAMVKGDEDAYEKIKEEAGLDGEEESQFDARALKIIPLVVYEEEVSKKADADEDMEVTEGGGFTTIASEDLYRKVHVSNFEMKSKDEDCQELLKQFENTVDISRIENKHKKKSNKVAYTVTFKDKESADNFLALPEVKFGDRVLTKTLLRSFIQMLILRRINGSAFAYHKRIAECVAKKGEEDRSVMINGIGFHKDEEIQELFCGLESEYENVASAKTIFFKSQKENSKRFFGYLLQFEDEEAADKFCLKKNKKFKEKTMRCMKISDIIEKNKMHRKKVNFDCGDVAEVSNDKQIVILRVKEPDVDQAETKIREIFKNVESVYRYYFYEDQMTIVTFASAEDAAAAVRAPGNSDLFRPVNVMGMEEYLEERGRLLEETKNKWESSDKKYENLKENNVKVEGNKIMVIDPRPPAKEKEKKQVKANEKTKAVEKVANANKTVQAEPVVKSAVLARRRNRGASEWDPYVVVGNLHPKMKNLGKPSDMDICNYFLHNHKDVADVKFLNWTENVFVKFKDVAAAEKFLTLNYVMFYGNDLHLNDVEGFLKKKTPAQKDEIAKVLLGKKFANISTTVTHPTTTPNVANGNMTMEVELSAFSSKQNNLRTMFISELHLSEDDVGQANWVKKDQKFSARLPVKLEESAISYMVKRWNDLKINVAGETVSAQMTTTTKGVKRENGQAKQGKSGKGNKKPKFSFYENY